MKKVDVLLGLQWGDEGKGKVVDVLAPHYDIIARFQGGPNAGHTLEFEGMSHVLHQIPSGVFRPAVKNIIGNGVVLDPIAFKNEVTKLIDLHVAVKQNVCISKKAALITPTHALLDCAYEKQKGKDKIGSTLKGIGPSYQDKVGRLGLRVGDILAPDFRARLEKLAAFHFDILKRYDTACTWSDLEPSFLAAVDFLKQFNLIDSEYFFNDAINAGSSILAEGAQGSLLDIDFGSYPFVTSSNTVAAGACIGMGVAPAHIGKVFGIFKAYGTRVGAGPFPTELLGAEGEKMRKEGNEFGSTTGRSRRCGWLDLPALKYAVMINGVSHLFMMKADVLNSFSHIKVCTHYRLANGTVTDRFPYELIHEKVEPIYVELEGWNTSLDRVDKETMPPALLSYVAFLERALEVSITHVSVGPDRTETISLVT